MPGTLYLLQTLMNKTGWELQRHMPRCKHKHGTAPGITSSWIMTGEREEEVKWVYPQKEPSDAEVRRLAAAVLEFGVRAVYQNHL